jgi:hypothetical protein
MLFKMHKQIVFGAFVRFALVSGVVSLAPGHVAEYDPAFDLDPAPLKYEHPGDLFHSLAGTCCASGVLTNVNSTGEIRNISGSICFPSD